ncbi:MAG: DNA polymerase III subunit alpha, partial [Planctomycetota bacterium]
AFSSGYAEGNAAYLRSLCNEGIVKRYGERASTPEIQDRLTHELGVIEKQGFVNYFLIVWDFVRFARDQRIPVGPGRGSAAGSIAAFALGITDIDPLRYDLLFERFLNPGRNEPPDIDIDFCERRREEVIHYVRERYGEANVCQIITFGTMKARAAVRDVGRVLEIPLPEVDVLAKKIPEDLTLEKALDQEPDLTERCENDPKVKQLFDIARRLEGMCRHASTHAAGVVISDKPLTEYVPLYTSKGDVTTQFAMDDLVKIGLLKMDFLGLKNLTIIDLTLKNIQSATGETVDLSRVPLDDGETLSLLSRGDTVGIFQLESSGMRDLLQKIRPDSFEDLIATIAIYRPGPLGSGMVDSYIAVKHGRQKPDYLHPELEPILKETHGMILYQEQAMRIANRLAGFSLTDADHLRKAMSKKKEALMAEYREQFVEGAIAGKKSADTAQKLFEQIRHFAGYGFNKSHSAAYAVLSYQTAYLKTHHPAAFMAASLSCRADVTDRVVKQVEECRRMGLEVLPPDINESRTDFTVEAPKIRYGLAAVRGVGEKAVHAILNARDDKGPFTSLFDFCRRVDSQTVNRKVTESLIHAGAFDRVGTNRAALTAGIDTAYEAGAVVQNDKAAGQKTFFDTFEESSGFQNEVLPDIPEWSERERLALEKTALGFYLTSHPLARYEPEIKAFSDTDIHGLFESKWDGQVLVGGMIAAPKVRRVRSGKNAGRPFASFNLEDLSGVMETVAFPDAWEQLKNLIVEDSIVFLKGRPEYRGGAVTLFVDEIIPVESGRQRLANRMVIALGFAGVAEETLQRVKTILEGHPGKCPVLIEFRDPTNRRFVIRAGDDIRVRPSEALEQDLNTLLGDGHVSFSRKREASAETPSPA